MSKPDPELFTLQKLIKGLSLVHRQHYISGTEQHENDIEHSFAVAVLSWYICMNSQLHLDISKVLKYALAHDFVEVYAGDVSTFATSEARAKKVEIERAALQRLKGELMHFPDMATILEDYEYKRDEEALFVWTVDKLQALIFGDMDDWRPYRELDITYEQFSHKYAELLSKASPYAKDIFNGVIRYSQSTYYDQPKA